MVLTERFEIIGHEAVRPGAERIVFCDGTDGRLFRPETDLELSHWRPNRTPAAYRAGTSTEICFRFLDNPERGPWTVAVNNHVDVDGILSVYVLLHGNHALAHRKTIIEAAEMGDFWGWGESAAQRVFQGITRLINSGSEPSAVYREAFRRIPGLIDGTDSDSAEIDQSLTPLRRGVELVEQGRITRKLLNDRLAHYVVPVELAADDDDRAQYVPEFNELISQKSLLWPQVRNRCDAERICLVSIERRSGWFHHLCFPGYLWADTQGLWQVPGLTYHDGMSSYDLDMPPLTDAFEQLQVEESASGRWGLGGTKLPLGKELQGRFPVVGRFCDENGRAAISRISPDRVMERLSRVLVF